MPESISIVIPVYNEVESLPRLYEALKKVMDGLDNPYEVVLVDDGSRDGSLKYLEELAERDSHIVVVSFRRNFGQTAAMAAGFEYSKGDVIITMDADLQNDPTDIPMMIEKIKGKDVVSGWRKFRKDPFLSRKLPSLVANWLISKVTGVKLHDYGCTLKAYRREVVENIKLYGEMHRFIPAIASWVGAEIIEVPTKHHPRRFGTSKYGISRTVRVVLDLITVRFLQSFSTRPIHAFGPPGLLMGFVGFLISLYLSYEKIIHGVDIGNRPLLLLGVLLIILGVQAVVMGLLGEMLARIYHESQDKPIFVVKKVLGQSLGEVRPEITKADKKVRGQ
ncbi:Glycosyl transferase, family 2 [hydrothermal vent metagenome]|uniref:Glycosyl transferase, family 2 n=1 Tax=hydrothermal vent metagenome TaxID=652676 RepID=A0A3B0QSN9_9ZZZZ